MSPYNKKNLIRLGKSELNLWHCWDLFENLNGSVCECLSFRRNIWDAWDINYIFHLISLMSMRIMQDSLWNRSHVIFLSYGDVFWFSNQLYKSRFYNNINRVKLLCKTTLLGGTEQTSSVRLYMCVLWAEGKTTTSWTRVMSLHKLHASAAAGLGKTKSVSNVCRALETLLFIVHSAKCHWCRVTYRPVTTHTFRLVQMKMSNLSKYCSVNFTSHTISLLDT